MYAKGRARDHQSMSNIVTGRSGTLELFVDGDCARNSKPAVVQKWKSTERTEAVKYPRCCCVLGKCVAVRLEARLSLINSSASPRVMFITHPPRIYTPRSG